jgi:predicted acyltransferase (DUF342 family)
MEVYQYNVGVQRYLSAASGSSSPMLISGTKTGVDWLKSTSCGGSASTDYLPCEFLSSTSQRTTAGGLSFSTEINYSPIEGLSAQTTLSELEVGGRSRSDLAGLAAMVASAAYVYNESELASSGSNGQVIFCPEIASMEATFTLLCTGAKGRIRSFASTLSMTDGLLRVDHGNAMTGILEFKKDDENNPQAQSPSSVSQVSSIDSNLRQIRNVARIYNLNNKGENSGSDNLYLGKGNIGGISPTLSSNGVIIDANQELLGTLRVRLDAKFDGNVVVQNDLSSEDGDIRAGDAPGGNNSSMAGNIIADGNISAEDDLSSGSSLFVGGDANVAGDAQVSGMVRIMNKLRADDSADLNGALEVQGDTALNGHTQINKNLNVKGNQLDMSGSYVLGDHTIYGESSTTGQSTIHGELKSNSGIQITRGNIYGYGSRISAKRFVDADDPLYVVDPSGTSYLESIVTDSIKLTKAVSLNGSCASEGNGTIARLVDGSAVSCTSGTWKKMIQDYTDTAMTCEPMEVACRSPVSGVQCSGGSANLTGTTGKNITVISSRTGNNKVGTKTNYATYVCATTGKFLKVAAWTVSTN